METDSVERFSGACSAFLESPGMQEMKLSVGKDDEVMDPCQWKEIDDVVPGDGLLYLLVNFDGDCFASGPSVFVWCSHNNKYVMRDWTSSRLRDASKATHCMPIPDVVSK